MTSSEANFTVPAASHRGLGCVGIVGVGLMGGSIGLALKAEHAAHRIIGIGRNPERLEIAKGLGAIDDWETDLARGVAQADLVILCTTIGHIVEQIPLVLESAPATSVITDIGSTKSAIVAAAAGDSRFIGGHPMTGSERAGVEVATARLYSGATWAITPTAATSETAIDTVAALITTVGARSLILAPEQHDAMVAVTSHLPHVMASALMRQAADLRQSIPSLPRMSAGSFADMTRVAASSPSIWRDVCLTNRKAVLEALEAFRGELKILEDAVDAGDASVIEAFFSQGEGAKRDWPSMRPG